MTCPIPEGSHKKTPQQSHNRSSKWSFGFTAASTESAGAQAGICVLQGFQIQWI